MEDNIINFVCGVVAGVLTGFGAGGALILAVLLNIVSNFSQLEIQTINLLYYIPTAFFALCVYSKNKNVNYKLGIKLIVIAAGTAIIGAEVAHVLDVNLLRRFFAVYLVVIGIVFFLQSSYFNGKKVREGNIG